MSGALVHRSEMPNEDRHGDGLSQANAPGHRSATGDRDDRPIATVDGHPISRRRMVDLLLASHGVGMLEQLIVLDAAERLAGEKGIHVSDEQVAAERERALRKLVDPLSTVSGEAFDEQEAERTLSSVLADRNISREEFSLVMRRNALLRAIVLAERTYSQQDLQDEFDRTYGETVTVRHIQLATLAEAARTRQRLADGESFEDAARTFSANMASAQRGGLLDPFTRTDDRVPEALRAAAFELAPGVVSSPIRVGEWFHLIKVEKREPPTDVSLESRRDELERRLQERGVEPAIRALYRDLFEAATIKIHDPALERAFRQAHSDRKR